MLGLPQGTARDNASGLCLWRPTCSRMSSDRRSFLKSAAALAAVAATPMEALSVAEQPARRALNAPLLAALGDTVLPESLGTTGRANAVRAFRDWAAAYTPVAEEMHGYGDAEITYTPADPAPNWNAQLEALDLLARQTKRRGFASLTVADRRDILRRQLAPVRGAALPSNPLNAAHVAVALLSHWATSSAAHDAAYDARIVRGECRGLGAVTRKPLPIAGERGTD
jgi:hypothetical protein